MKSNQPNPPPSDDGSHMVGMLVARNPHTKELEIGSQFWLVMPNTLRSHPSIPFLPHLGAGGLPELAKVTPTIVPSEKIALAIADGLAKKHPGQLFVVLEVTHLVGKCLNPECGGEVHIQAFNEEGNPEDCEPITPAAPKKQAAKKPKSGKPASMPPPPSDLTRN